MAEEPNNNREEIKSSTDINDLVEEVERLLKEVEEKEKVEQEKDRDITGEIKEILEKPEKKKSKTKLEEKVQEVENEEKLEKTKRGRGRPKKISPTYEIKGKKDIFKEEKDKYKDKDIENIIEQKDYKKHDDNEIKETSKKIIIEKKEDSTELITIKGENKELTISKDQLEKIENEIRKQKDLPKSDKDLINKKIFKNIIIGVFIVLFFISVNIGFLKLKEETFLNDLRVFSGILIAATIFIFEKAYRKESGELTILGIETLVLSIVTLLTNYIYTEFNGKFLYITNTVSMIFAIYYVGKSIISYIKMRKAVLNKISDIRNIINRSK